MPAFEILDMPEDEIQRQLHSARLQFSAGARRRDRHLAFRLPARRPCRSRRPGGGRAVALHRHRSRTAISFGRNALGHAICRLPRRPARTAPTGASAISCFRSGPRRRTASSAVTCMRAAWVPLDDSHTMFVLPLVEAGGLGDVAAAAGLQGRHADRRHRTRQQATAQYVRLARALADGGQSGNDWKIDRAAQQNNTIYSGIDGIHLQDQAITESMGPIVDHAFEHLAPSDQMITRTRRRLLMAARALRDKGIAAAGRRGPRASIAARAAATSSAMTRATGKRSMPGSWRQACTRRRPSMRPNEVRHFGCASGPLSSSPLR